MADGIEQGANGAGAIAVPDRIDLGAARRLRDACLAAEGDIVIDAGAVTVATTPAFQVLMAARDRQAARGRAMRVAPASEAFVGCARTLGIPMARLETGGTGA